MINKCTSIRGIEYHDINILYVMATRLYIANVCS